MRDAGKWLRRTGPARGLSTGRAAAREAGEAPPHTPGVEAGLARSRALPHARAGSGLTGVPARTMREDRVSRHGACRALADVDRVTGEARRRGGCARAGGRAAPRVGQSRSDPHARQRPPRLKGAAAASRGAARPATTSPSTTSSGVTAYAELLPRNTSARTPAHGVRQAHVTTALLRGHGVQVERVTTRQRRATAEGVRRCSNRGRPCVCTGATGLAEQQVERMNRAGPGMAVRQNVGQRGGRGFRTARHQTL